MVLSRDLSVGEGRQFRHTELLDTTCEILLYSPFGKGGQYFRSRELSNHEASRRAVTWGVFERGPTLGILIPSRYAHSGQITLDCVLGSLDLLELLPQTLHLGRDFRLLCTRLFL